MSNILNTEVNNLFQKHNIPQELIEILADDAIRITLDGRSPIERGLTFSSNDDGKLFAITRCIERLRKMDSVYSKPLDDSGCISYTNNPQEGLKTRRKEQVIDLDTINIEEERKKSLFRYADTFIENRFTIENLNTEIDQMSKCYTQLNDINRKIGKLNRRLENSKAKVTEIEVSPIPNIFRFRKLKRYREKVRSYMSQIDKAEKLREKAEDACEKAEPLVSPRKSRLQKIMGYNGIINSRIGELLQKHKISPDILKEYVIENYGGANFPEMLSLLPKGDRARESRGR